MTKKTSYYLLIIISAMILFTSCNNSDIEVRENINTTVDTAEETDTTQTPISKYKKTLTQEMYNFNAYFFDFDNNVDFIYDENSTLEVEDLNRFEAIGTLEWVHPWFAIRKNKGRIYTIYSLSGGRLYYLEIQHSMDTGLRFYANNRVVYPFEDEEEKFIYDFLLEKDYPENIMKSGD